MLSILWTNKDSYPALELKYIVLRISAPKSIYRQGRIARWQHEPHLKKISNESSKHQTYSSLTRLRHILFVSKNLFFINRIIIGDLVTHVGLWHDENVGGSKIIDFPSKCNFCSTPRINSYLQPVFDGCPQNHLWAKRKWSLCKFLAQIVFEVEFHVISLICSQLTN